VLVLVRVVLPTIKFIISKNIGLEAKLNLRLGKLRLLGVFLVKRGKSRDLLASPNFRKVERRANLSIA